MDYSDNIDTTLYKYRRTLIVTNSSEDKTFAPLKLSLNSSNFNFDLARSDGLDFRLAEKSNGTGVLHMWVAYWNSTKKVATLWFKLPEILAGKVKTLYAFWGYASDSGVSDLGYLLGESVGGGSTSTPVFIFGDDFNEPTLNSTKWPSTNGSWSIADSCINLGEDAWIQTLTGAISTTPPVNWIVEEGVVGIGSPTSTTVGAHRIRFYGGENVLGINYFWDGSTDRSHDFVYAGTYSTYNGTNKGLEIGSYSNNYIGYYEPTDRVYQGMSNRYTYSDYDDSWERKVHRNTELDRVRIYGEDTSAANGVKIDWIIIRAFNPNTELIIDYSDLWVQHEYVGHQAIDYIEYGSDITSVDYHHLSDMGGDPYRLSDNITNSISNIFISSDGVSSGSITIDFGRGADSVTNKSYIHFDSSRVEYYNASKLSDLDGDVHSRDYWQATTTSGWAAIQFPTTKNICCLSLKAVSGSTTKMAKNFKFYGSQSDPRFIGWNDKVLLYEGTALQTTQEQTFYFSTGATYYKYYILDVLDTYGGNIAIQEWGMYEQTGHLSKKVVSQLRLYPVTFADNEYYFPKNIIFYGSNDGFNWDTLISGTETPTPFTDYVYGRWSRYSFENNESYYLYKLSCSNNWNAGEDKIKIAEWEMVERLDEVNSFRILEGTNNINNIWADPIASIDTGNLYVTNTFLNVVADEKLISYTTLSGSVDDFNVRL